MDKDHIISLEDTVTQKSGNIASDMDGEKVMLSIHNGKYYNLGKVGGEIWALMSETISVSGLVTALMSEYDVEQSECKEQVTSFLEMLVKEELIEVMEKTVS